MRALKQLSLLIMPLLILSYSSCKNNFVDREIEIRYIKLDSDKIEFETTGGSKIMTVKTSFTFIDIESSESWCEAELNDDNTELTITVNASDVMERTAILKLAGTGVESKLTVIQSDMNDVRIPIIGAKPDKTDVYSADNQIEKAYDLDAEGNGNPATWWLTPQTGNSYPYNVIFLVDNAKKIDYLVYTPKQHQTNATNVNGCLGKVEIWWTSATDAENAADTEFTKYGEYDWGKSRALPGPVIVFNPALENVTGVKLRMMEAGGGTTDVNGWVGIGDVQLWKLGAGKSLSSLDVNPATLSFGMTGEPQTVTIDTNIEEELIITSGAPAWCSVSTVVDGKFTVSVTPNGEATSVARTTAVTVSGGGVSKTIAVSQDGPRLTADKNSLIFETEDTDPKAATITTNLTGITVTQPTEDTWYTAEFENNELKVTVDAAGDGMRTSVVTLTASNGTAKKIEVAQKGLNDTRVDVGSAWAQTFNSANPVEYSYDANDGTWFMVNYQSTFPLDVVYYFTKADRISHFIYHAKTNNANGRLGKVEVFYSTIAYPTPDPEAAFVSAGVCDWEKSADVRVVKFDEQIANPTAIKLRILETGGGSSATATYAGIKEIEFYKIGAEPTPVFDLDTDELSFDAAADSKTVNVDTNLTGAITAAALPADTWCTPTVNGTVVTVAVTAASKTRSTTVTVKAPNGMEKEITVTQTVPDIKLTVSSAKPAKDTAYSDSNKIEKAYDEKEGKGDPSTWWIMPQSGNEYPYDVIFHVAADRMDYLVYSAKQHTSPTNVNGCLGKVEIYYTSATDPDDDAAVYTKYGGTVDWLKTRTPVERKVEFTPSLNNVTAVKLRILEPGGNTTADDGWAGIGDMSFFKYANN